MASIAQCVHNIITSIIIVIVSTNILNCIILLQATNIVRFEVDDKKLSELLGQVADVGKAIDSYAHS